MDFVKKLIAFNKKQNVKITKDEINSISDKEAEIFLENCPIDSLIDLKREGIYLKKELFSLINGFIACIGAPKQGKSSLCSGLYKTLYGLDKEIFTVSNSYFRFTKGLWVIKQREKNTIQEKIEKDIIDTEGFQSDDLSTWKYIMIVAFISTDIIVVNRNYRLDEVKKIMIIIWNSLEKMEHLGLPKILKTIWIQITKEKYKKSFENNMNK